MITKIDLKNVASYDSQGVSFENLNALNFIYGNNGCGKSTFSKVLRSPEQFEHCYIEKSEEYKMIVYNKDFITSNFNQSNEIPGIFTLGKDAVEVQKRIKELQDKRNHLITKKNSCEGGISEEDVKLNKIEKDFIERAWDLKTKYDQEFSRILRGVRGSKRMFKDALTERMDSITDDSDNLTDLLKDIERIYSGNPKRLVEIELFDVMKFKEVDFTLLSEKIIGKQDLDISDLIQSLNIDDWVLVGKNYFDSTNDKCPFCQQQVPLNIKKQLEDYFDTSYLLKTSKLADLRKSVEANWQDLILYIEDILINTKEVINPDTLNKIQKDVIDLKKEILQIINLKIKEPSAVCSLPSIEEFSNNLIKDLEYIKSEILSYNNKIENIQKERELLANKVWNFLLNEIKSEYDKYNREYSISRKILQGKRNTLGRINSDIQTLDNEIDELKATALGIDETVVKINSQLKSFGFSNFRLNATADKGIYQILRPNGEIAQETLSEGEKTFITFLYYYNLIMSSSLGDDNNKSKILVIDDPISSLDSKILFIVSTLIRNLLSEVGKEELGIKQIFILTHNTYFYKEVTNRIKDNCSYYILSKYNDATSVIAYTENPIKNSYQLLWDELSLSLDSPVSITQNIMRRILENYFSFTGNIQLYEFTSYFQNEEIDICKSLIAWLHDGSHSIFEDLYVNSIMETKQLYFKVFKNIFYNTGHIGHFDMMVNNSFDAEKRMIFENEVESNIFEYVN